MVQNLQKEGLGFKNDKGVYMGDKINDSGLQRRKKKWKLNLPTIYEQENYML